MKKKNLIIGAGIVAVALTGVAIAKIVKTVKKKEETVVGFSMIDLINIEEIPFVNAEKFVNEVPVVWFDRVLSSRNVIEDFDDKACFVKYDDVRDALIIMDCCNHQARVVYNAEDDIMSVVMAQSALHPIWGDKNEGTMAEE